MVIMTNIMYLDSVQLNSLSNDLNNITKYVLIFVDMIFRSQMLLPLCCSKLLKHPN